MYKTFPDSSPNYKLSNSNYLLNMYSVRKVHVQLHVVLHFSVKNFTINQNLPYSFKRKKCYRLASLYNGQFFFEKSGNGNVCNVSSCTAFEQLYHQKCNNGTLLPKGTIHLRCRQIFTIFDLYPPTLTFQQNAYEGDFLPLCTVIF